MKERIIISRVGLDPLATLAEAARLAPDTSIVLRDKYGVVGTTIRRLPGPGRELFVIGHLNGRADHDTRMDANELLGWLRRVRIEAS